MTAEDRPYIPIEVIDENDTQNILSDPNRDFILNLKSTFSNVSSEGFHQNIEGQQRIAKFLYARFVDSLRMGILDVGFGENLHIARTLTELGIRVCAIDIRSDPRWIIYQKTV